VAPRITIGLPVYNGERYLAEAIGSILDQDFENFELLVSDNASNDGTQEICEAFAQADKRVIYSRVTENVGAAANFNRVFRMSESPLFKWAAHDDRLKRTFLSRCIDAHDSLETLASLVYPRSELVDENGSLLGPPPGKVLRATASRASFRAYQALQGMGTVADAVFGVFRRRALERTRLIGAFYAADRVLVFEAALLGKIHQLSGEPLLQRRVHPGMSTKAQRSHEERLKWYDPEARATISPGKRIALEYFRSAARIEDLSPMERALCFPATVGGIAVREIRVPLGHHRRALISRLEAARARLR
jgi:glycosyltransferase involved in cell wall biosynthesis